MEGRKRKENNIEEISRGDIYVQSEKLEIRDSLSTDSWMPTKTRRIFG